MRENWSGNIFSADYDLIPSDIFQMYSTCLKMRENLTSHPNTADERYQLFFDTHAVALGDPESKGH